MAGAYRIILMGKTGTGKSATGNTLLGRAAFHSMKGGNSVTDTCVMDKAESNTLQSCIVDTPGLFDTKCVAKRALDIQNAMNLCPNPHAFLLILNAATRVTPEDGCTIDMLEMIFGPSVFDRTIVVFTHGDELQNDEAFEDFWNDTPELADIVERCGNRVCRVENTEPLLGEQFQEHPLYQLISKLSMNGAKVYSYEFSEQRETAFKGYIDSFRGNIKAIEQIQAVNIAIEQLIKDEQVKRKNTEIEFKKELEQEDEALRQEKLKWEKTKQAAMEKLQEDARKWEIEQQHLEDELKEKYRKSEERRKEEERMLKEERRRQEAERELAEQEREEEWKRRQEDMAKADAKREEWSRQMEEQTAKREEEFRQREEALREEGKRQREEMEAKQDELRKETEMRTVALRQQIEAVSGQQPPQTGECMSVDSLLMAASVAALQTPYAPYVLPVIGAVAAVKAIKKK